jgi:hypothetical protein
LLTELDFSEPPSLGERVADGNPPFEHPNKKSARRNGVVGISSSDESLIRLASTLPIELSGEWLAGRRCLSFDSLAALGIVWNTHGARPGAKLAAGGPAHRPVTTATFTDYCRSGDVALATPRYGGLQ